MTMAMNGLLLAGWLAVQASGAAVSAPATTQAAAPCPAGPAAALSPELSGWSAMQGVDAGTSVASPPTLAIGRSARATLVPADSVRFAVAPDKPAAAGSTAGVFAFDVAGAGTYRVALDAGIWVDVVTGGKALASVAHGHGPDCSGIRKYVDYRLTPGRYILQASGGRAPTLAVMVAKLPG
jgi:hypothetical protein